MEARLNAILSQLESKRIFVGDNYFSKEFLNSINSLFDERWNKGLFRAAKIGKGVLKQSHRSIRGDKIFWVDDWQLEDSLKTYSIFLQNLMHVVRREFFIPLKRFEGHFSAYEPGSFYKKHLDQHKRNPHRHLTCVYYLSNWKPGEGGELILYPKGEQPVVVEPWPGRFCCFMSAKLPHEVKFCHHTRRSLTSWLRDDVLIL